MNSPEQLRELASRVEQASGPDRALMCAAYKAAFPEVSSGTWGAIDAWDKGYDRFCAMLDAGAHLDAAMLLVPEGLQLAIYTGWPLTAGFPEQPDGGWIITDDMPRGCWVRTYGAEDPEMEGATRNVHGTGRTPALALCAAALKARASLASETANG